MTDHDAPETHAVDDTIADALRRSERQATRHVADDVLDAARSARDRHARDRRRRIRVATLGAAAAVLLAVVWVTVIVIIVLVQLAQALGNRLSRRAMHHH